MADEAAMLADEAASMAEVAAEEAAIDAPDASEAPIDGVVTTVVDEVDGVLIVEAGGVVVVVVVSSFLLQAAKDTAAARLTIKIAVLMFLLEGFWFEQLPEIVGTHLSKSPIIQRQGTLQHFQCLTLDYRRLRDFPSEAERGHGKGIG